MEIFVYKGTSNLPTIDFDCLRTLCYIKTINAPVKITKSNKPFMSPNGFLPYLQHEGIKIAGYSNIVKYLQDNGLALKPNKELDFLSKSYISFLNNNLYPSLCYSLWGDLQNQELSRTLYAERTQFPFNFYHPQKYIAKVDKLMQVNEHFRLDDKLEYHKANELNEYAQNSLKLLDTKLANKLNLLLHFTEVDIHLYTYIALIEYFPMKNSHLKILLSQCPNLTKYIKTFRNIHLKDSSLFEIEKVSLHHTTLELDDDKNFSKKLPKILAVFVALAAMTAFAYKEGLFKSNNDAYLEYEDIDDDDGLE